LGASLAERLDGERRRQLTERLRLGAEWPAPDLVFTKANGKPLDLKSVCAGFKRIVARAGLSSLRLYDLRHSCASFLISVGLNPKVFAERLGHANISMTLATYSHVTRGLQSDASSRVEEALFGTVGTLLAHN
jgi:integrase